MKYIITALVLFVSTLSYAKPKTDSDGCYYKTVKVCPLHKKKQKLVVVPLPLTQIEYRDVVHEVPVPTKCPPPGTVVVYRSPLCPENKNFVIGAYVAVGLGVQDPYVSGNIGLRLRIPKAYLGFQAYSALQYGFVFQSLIYVYQSKRVNLHIVDPGVLISGPTFSYLGENDVKRRVDLLIGMGVEVRLACHLALTADLRTNIPDPTVLADKSSCRMGCSRRVDLGNVIGNSFASTELLIGILVRN